MKQRRRQSGFVLVMVLIILVVAGMMLAATARQSATESLAANAEMRDLQLRWARRSIRDVYLETPEAILLAAADYESPGASVLDTFVKLGDHRFRIVLTDEQAKVNVNALAANHNEATLASRLRDCLGNDQDSITITLEPTKLASPGHTRHPMLYQSYDQILAYDHPGILMPAASLQDSPAQRLTCWSDGRLNIKKCGEDTLRIGLQGILNVTQQSNLKKYCDDNPDCTLREALFKTVDSRRARMKAAAALTDTSNCHALWIITETETRNWYCLYVRQSAGAGRDSREWYFEW